MFHYCYNVTTKISIRGRADSRAFYCFKANFIRIGMSNGLQVDVHLL